MAPPNITVQLVEKPNEALVEEAVQLFSALMLADPATIVYVGGDTSLIPTMARAMVRPVALLSGHMYTATDENGILIGYTLWLPPGQNVFTSDEQRQLGFNDFFDLLSEEGKAYHNQVLGKFSSFIDESVGIPSAELNCYWCNFAMVRADYHGKGVAKALFALAYDKAKQTGATMALGTTDARNVVIYEKIGLQLKGQTTTPSPWGDWSVWIFARDTKSI